MESFEQIVEVLSQIGLSEAIVLAAFAFLPHLLKYANDKRLSRQSRIQTEAQADLKHAEAGKTRADTMDVISDTSIQWIERLNKDVVKLTARADSVDAANKILLEQNINERVRRKELDASVKILSDRLKADQKKSKIDAARHQAERDAARMEKESLKKFWENDRILLMTEVERCYTELKGLIASIEESTENNEKKSNG